MIFTLAFLLASLDSPENFCEKMRNVRSYLANLLVKLTKKLKTMWNFAVKNLRKNCCSCKNFAIIQYFLRNFLFFREILAFLFREKLCIFFAEQIKARNHENSWKFSRFRKQTNSEKMRNFRRKFFSFADRFPLFAGKPRHDIWFVLMKKPPHYIIL